MRIAALDIGSNAIRYCVYEFQKGIEQPTLLEKNRYPVRLGKSVFLTGNLDSKTIDEAIEAFKEIKTRLQFLNVEQYRAVATSAVREGKNRIEFISRAKKESDIDVEVISGTEEAILIYKAIHNKIQFSLNPWMLVDLGGGSVEVTLANSEGIMWSESHAIGAVRVLEELVDSDSNSYENTVKDYISHIKLPKLDMSNSIEGMAATGGNIEEIAKIAGHDSNGGGIAKLSMQELRKTIELLLTHNYSERISKLGLKPDRADVILPAALVYEKIAQLGGVENITVPNVGVKDGVIFDLYEKMFLRNHYESTEQNDLVSSAVKLGRKYFFDEPHAMKVTELSLSIFDQLTHLHRFGQKERKILNVASILHDIGQFISYEKHHKHSLYIISQSELPHFSSYEMLMAANVARYHRRSEPKQLHQEYVKLTPADQLIISILASILRIADSLDSEHLQRIESTKVRTDNHFLYLGLKSLTAHPMEMLKLTKKADFFKKLFNLNLKIEEL
jgi:exopolyphosphatase/guanosine-5'-triphosphate,3'-diphosphate pyrophosphatase